MPLRTVGANWWDRGRPGGRPTGRRGAMAVRLPWLACVPLACVALLVGVSAEQVKKPGPTVRFVEVTAGAGIAFTHRHGGNGMKYYIETVPPGNCWLLSAESK